MFEICIFRAPHNSCLSIPWNSILIVPFFWHIKKNLSYSPVKREKKARNVKVVVAVNQNALQLLSEGNVEKIVLHLLTDAFISMVTICHYAI